MHILKIILKETICIKKPPHGNNSNEKPLHTNNSLPHANNVYEKPSHTNNSNEKPLYKQFS